MQTQLWVGLLWLWLMFNVHVFTPWNLFGWELGARLGALLRSWM